MSTAKGGYYYRDHLPILGEKAFIKMDTKKTNTSTTKSDQNCETKTADVKPAMSKQKSKNRLEVGDIKSRTSSDSDNPDVIVTNSDKKELIKRKSKQKLFKTSSSQLFLKSGGVDLNPAFHALRQQFKVDDYVNIDLDFEIVQSLQVGHGGWSEAMFECLGKTGRITRIDSDHDIEVVYPSGNKWTFNPAVLTRVSVEGDESAAKLNDQFYGLNVNGLQKMGSRSNLTNGDESEEIQFSANDSVQICGDLELVKMLQRGHGEWTSDMEPVLGKYGVVRQVFADGDLKIEINGTCWTFNPTLVRRAQRESKLPTITTTKMDSMDEESSDTVRSPSLSPNGQLLKAAASGDYEQCESLMLSECTCLNALHSGHAPLHAACQNGHLNIIELMYKHNVDLEIEVRMKIHFQLGNLESVV